MIVQINSIMIFQVISQMMIIVFMIMTLIVIMIFLIMMIVIMMIMMMVAMSMLIMVFMKFTIMIMMIMMMIRQPMLKSLYTYTWTNFRMIFDSELASDIPWMPALFREHFTIFFNCMRFFFNRITALDLFKKLQNIFIGNDLLMKNLT